MNEAWPNTRQVDALPATPLEPELEDLRVENAELRTRIRELTAEVEGLRVAHSLEVGSLNLRLTEAKKKARLQ